MTTGWRVLSIDHRDPVAPFEDVVRLIDVAGTATSAAYSRSDVIEALHEHQPAAVAVSAERLVGAAVARVCGADAHLWPWRCTRSGATSASARRSCASSIKGSSTRVPTGCWPWSSPVRWARSRSPTRVSPASTACTSTYAPRRWSPRARHRRTLRRALPPARPLGLDEGIFLDQGPSRTPHRGAIGARRSGRSHRPRPTSGGYAIRTTRDRKDFVRSRCCVATFMVVRRTPPLPTRPGHACCHLPTRRTRRLAARRASGVLHRRGRRDRLARTARPTASRL